MKLRQLGQFHRHARTTLRILSQTCEKNNEEHTGLYRHAGKAHSSHVAINSPSSRPSSLFAMAEEAVDFKLFRCEPNLGAAVFFILLFTAAASLHTYQYVVTKTWFFTAFIVGCWCRSASASSIVFRNANRFRAVEVIGFLTVCQYRSPPDVLLTQLQESYCSGRSSQFYRTRVLNSHYIRLGSAISLCS